MTWTALVALKPAEDRKTRLAGQLSPFDRVRLTSDLLGIARDALARSRYVSRAVLLSRDVEPSWRGDRLPDAGRGLNNELSNARRAIGPSPLLVMFPDLPLVTASDVDALIEAAAGDGAIAPDRHGTGTNAVAIPAPKPFLFRFGAGSFQAHRAAHPALRIVPRSGLGFDIDTPSDLALAGGLGFRQGHIGLTSPRDVAAAPFAADPRQYRFGRGLA